MRQIFLFLMLFSVVSLGGVSSSYAGSFFDRFLKAEQAEVTVDEQGVLHAPFSSGEVKGKGIIPFLEAVPLDQPHRDTVALVKWLTVVASESMTFKTEDFNKEMMERSAYFTTAGGARFIEFLKSKNIYDVYGSHGLFLHGAVVGTPLLVKEGASNGVYHWVFDVPLVATYMRPKYKNYTDLPKGLGKNTQNMTVRVQVNRVNEDWTWDGLAIETWQEIAQKRDKP